MLRELILATLIWNIALETYQHMILRREISGFPNIQLRLVLILFLFFHPFIIIFLHEFYSLKYNHVHLIILIPHCTVKLLFSLYNLVVFGVTATVVDSLNAGLKMNLLAGGIIAQFAPELTDPQVLHVNVDLKSKI